MQLNPMDVPLSRFGSYLGISSTWPHRRPSAEPEGWYLRWIRDDASTLIFRIELVRDGIPVAADATASVGRLTLRTADGGEASFTLPDTEQLAIRCRGVGVRFTTLSGAYCYGNQLRPGFWEVMPAGGQPRFGFRASLGRVTGETHWEYDGKASRCAAVDITLQPQADEASMEGCVRVYDDVWLDEGPPRSFDDAAAEVEQAFARWRDSIADPPGADRATTDLAAYILWLNTVEAHGLYPSPVVLGSKNWMKVVWSWDHCFTALGLARAHPELAWQQFRLMIPMQGPSGMLCDVLRTNRRSWVCTKSPVHGWTLAHLRCLIPTLTEAQLADIYEPMKRWTDFWLTHRNLDGDGLPCLLYPNESFDATTHTAVNAPCKAPDHAAYLVLQCEAMAQLAGDLGHDDDAHRFADAGRRVLDAMLKHLWIGDRFVAKRTGDGFSPPGDCIFQYVPLLLGKRLPETVTRPMVERLQTAGALFSDFGLTTEAMDSDLFDPEAYVRGRIWTPPNWMIPEGLDALGERDLAADIRRKYLRTLERGGMSECFDPRDGRPLEDPAYNWTAASYLVLTDPPAPLALPDAAATASA